MEYDAEFRLIEFDMRNPGQIQERCATLTSLVQDGYSLKEITASNQGSKLLVTAVLEPPQRAEGKVTPQA